MYQPIPIRRIIDDWLRYSFVGYQLRWILDPSLFAVANKSRQIGFSDATSGRAVYNGLGRGRPQLVLSASQDLADEVLAKARTHCRVLAASGHHWATRYTVDNATEIAWSNGGRIVALPANPRTARSFSGDVHLDEFAYHVDPEGIRDGAFAMASRGNYSIRILSTPNGAQGHFYDWCQSPPPGWTLHHITVEDAIADGFPASIEKLWQLCGGDERIFEQWYRCKFLDADLQYYPTAMLEVARNWKGNIPDLRDVEIYAGLDVGREVDLTALTVVALAKNTMWQLATMTCKRTSFKEQKAMIRQARSAFGWETLHVDETGIGRQIAEELVEEFGSSEVKPVSFTAKSKENMVTRALRWFRDGRVRLERGADGAALVREAASMRRKVTASGNVVYEVPRTQAGHGDRLWSFLLAAWGAGEPASPRGLGQSPLLSVA